MSLSRYAAIAILALLLFNLPSLVQAQPTVDSISHLFDRGEYREVIRLAHEYLAVDPFSPEVVDFDVHSGLLGENCDGYVSDVLSGTDTSKAGLLRKMDLLLMLGQCQEAKATLEAIGVGGIPKGVDDYWRSLLAYFDGQDSLALQYCTSAANDPNSRGVALQELYRWYSDRGELNRADSILDQLDPGSRLNPWIVSCRADLTGLRGNWPDALKQFARAAKEYNDPRIYQLWSYDLIMLGRFNEAIEVINRGLDNLPKNKWLQAKLVWALDRVGRHDEAKRLVAGMPRRQVAYLNLATDLIEAFTLDDTLNIQTLARELLTYKPDFTFAAQRYLIWLDERGRASEADSLVDHLSHICSALDMATIKSARLETESPDQAVRLFDSLFPSWNRIGNETESRIRRLMGSGRRAEAEALVDSILSLCPGEMDILICMAETEFYADNLEAAQSWLDRAEDLAPGNAQALWTRMLLAHKQSDRSTTLTCLDSILVSYPSWSELLWYYREMYGPEDSLQLRDVIHRYERNSGHGVNYITELALTYTQIGDYQTADSLLAAEIGRHPTAALLYFYRGLVNNQAGNTEKADNFHSQALALDPANPYYRRGAISSTLEAQPLQDFTRSEKTDSTALILLSVDSVRSLAAAAGDTPTEYGGITLLDKRQFISHDEYRGLRRRHYIAKVVSSKGKEYYGTRTEPFNAWSEVPCMLLARVIQPDGRVVNIAPSDIQVTGSSKSTSADSRNVAWQYPQIDSGAIVEYVLQYQLRHSEAFDMGDILLANDWDPVRNWSVELLIPDSWQINEFHTAGLSHKVYDSSGIHIYRWSADSLKTLKWEDDCSGTWAQGDWMRFAYRKTWREEADRYWKRSAVKYDTAGPVAELAHSLTTGKRNREDKIAALFTYVARNIRYEAVEFGEGSIIPRPAAQILSNRYGDCKDKSVLLISLLKAVGITAYPALITGYDTLTFTRGVPDMNVFSHMITYLPGKPGRFLDPTCEACLPYDLAVDYKGKPTLVIGSDLDDPLLMTPPPEPTDRSFHRSTRMSAKPDGGLAMDILMEYQGDPVINWKSYHNSDTTTLAEKIKNYTGIGFWTTADFLDYKLIDRLDDPGLRFSWTARMEMDSIFTKDASRAYVNLWFYTINDFLSLPDTAGRTLDLRLGPRFQVTEDYTIVPGSRWMLNDYRLSWTMDTTWFTASSSVVEWPDSLRVSVAFTLKSTLVPASEFKQFVEAVELVKKRVFNQSPIYRRVPDPERIASVKQTLDKYPTDLSLLMTLTQLYLGDDLGGSRCEAKERREEARTVLQQALGHDASNEGVVTMLTSLLIIDGEPYQADSLLQTYASNHPMSMVLRSLSASTAILLARYDVAEKEYLKLMGESPNDELRAQLVSIYANQGKLTEARTQVDILETLKTDSSVWMRALLNYYLASDSLEQAENLINIWPDTSQFERAGLKSTIYQYTGNFRGAYTEFADMLSRDPDNVTFLNNCAWFMALAGIDLDRALELANKAMTLTGGCNAGYRNTLALVLLKMGRTKEARHEFEACLVDQSAQSQTLNQYFLGECALAEKNPQLATECFTKACEANGDRRYVRDAVAKLKELGAPSEACH
jgi:tetratricopeptide (TPR) repeat protein